MRLSSFQLAWIGRAWDAGFLTGSFMRNKTREQSAVSLCLAVRATNDRTNILVTVSGAHGDQALNQNSLSAAIFISSVAGMLYMCLIYLK